MGELFLRKGRERSVINRHPWVFSGAVEKIIHGKDGEIISIHRNDGQLLGYGFLDIKSQITVKIFHFGNTVMVFDENYWYFKLLDILQKKTTWVNSNQTSAFRLIHAEGDGFPGIIIDIYNNVAVVQVLHVGIQNILPDIFSSLKKLGFIIYKKVKESSKWIENITITEGFHNNECIDFPLIIKENNLKFIVNPSEGQKTGFFLDQRENRLLLQQYAAGKSVLNTFSYTGGFSVYAGKGNAERITSIDISKSAIEICNQNMTINGFSNLNHGVVEDCFLYLKNLKEGEYDLIILDPPAFAKNAKALKNATRGYKEINLSAFKKIRKGGVIFTFSCSKNIDKDLFRKIVFSAAADSEREVQILHQLTQPPDHPISIYHPEGEYLKGLVLSVN